MPDYIGTVPVPDLTPSGTFPFVTDYPHGRTIEPQIVMHPFTGANRKVEQRFLIGIGRKWRSSFGNLTDEEMLLLRDFWDARQGPYQPFTLYAPTDERGLDTGATTPVNVQFEDAPLTFDRFIERCATGITFVEVPLNSGAPVYGLNAILDRFPDAVLEQALLGQVQRLIPLVTISPLDPNYPPMYLSDRRCTIGSQLFQARLMTWNNISQKLGGQADNATFVFGNADRVMREVANSTDLYLADVSFALFHIDTGSMVRIWRGQAVNYISTSKTEFELSCTDGVQKLTLQYPIDRVNNTCWKQQSGRYNDGQTCPFAANGSLNPSYPAADASFCDGGYITDNGCKAHNMKRWYGGIQLEPQTVFIRDSTTGFFGAGRLSATSTSQVSDSVMNMPLREVYTDLPMPVACMMAAGRDEDTFYHAMGIVGGPITEFGGTLFNQIFDSSGNARYNTLDDQFDASWPVTDGAVYPGRDPAAPTDYFSLNQSGNQVKGDPNKVFTGHSTVLDNYAAGVSFIVMRRVDDKGFQLSTLQEHTMNAWVGKGMSGWIWTAPGVRSQQVLTNPVWVAVHVYLRGIGLRAAPIEQAELYLDVNAAVAAAAICDLQVPKLIGSGMETQFVLRGVIEDIKPLKDWIQEILNNCMGSFVMSNGKLKIIVREDAAAAHSFSAGNMVADSLTLAPRKPEFNRVNVQFGNSDYDWVKDGLPISAADHVLYIGQTLDGYLNLLGSSKSMAARCGGVFLKEQLGGATLAEWAKARVASWKSTVLAMGVEVGIGVSIDDPDMPGGTGLMRVTGWTLNPDYSVDFQGETITDSMYDQVAGPKLEDVPSNGVQVEMFPEPGQSAWCPDYEIPVAGDPLYSPNDRTFGVRFAFQQAEDPVNSYQQIAVAVVTGERAVNVYAPNTQPPIVRGQTSSTAGGSLADGVYYARVYMQDTLGRWSPGSNMRHFSFTSGSNANYLTLSDVVVPAPPADAIWSRQALFMGDDEKTICWQQNFGAPGQTSITCVGPLKQSTYNAPSIMHQTVIVKAKRGLHFGAVGLAVNTVTSGGIQSDGLRNFYPDPTGRWVYFYSDYSDGSSRADHYLVTGFDAATGNIALTPDPLAGGIEHFDLFTFRLKPIIFRNGGTIIGDPMIQNSQYPAGATKPELGSVIRGVTPGKPHQLRYVSARPSVYEYQVDRPFDYAPTYWVNEFPSWEYTSNATIVPVPLLGNMVDLTCNIYNLAGQPVTVGAFLVDIKGRSTPEEYAVIREGYVPTAPPPVSRELAEGPAPRRREPPAEK